MRGLRVNAASVGELNPEKIRERIAVTAKQAEANGYHLQLFINAATLTPLADYVRSLPITVVIDHFGLCSLGAEGTGAGRYDVPLAGYGALSG